MRKVQRKRAAPFTARSGHKKFDVFEAEPSNFFIYIRTVLGRPRTVLGGIRYQAEVARIPRRGVDPIGFYIGRLLMSGRHILDVR